MNVLVIVLETMMMVTIIKFQMMYLFFEIFVLCEIVYCCGSDVEGGFIG